MSPSNENTSPETENNLVTVEGEAASLTQKIQMGRHSGLSDEPKELGGQDKGPTPYDLLMASLGSCTSMTLFLYAQRKGWGLKKVTVHLSHGKIHAEDCRDCESESGKIEEIQRKIHLDGNLDEKQRSRLIEIADRCPVHRTLSGEIKIRTKEI